MAKALVAGWGVAAFITGIALAGLHGRWIIPAITVIAGGASFFRIPVRSAFAAISIGILLGAFYYSAFFALRNARRVLPPPNVEFAGIIADEPYRSGEVTIFTIDLLPPFRGGVKVLHHDDFSYGDKVTFRGRIALSSSERDPPLLRFPDLLSREADHGSRLRAWLISLKRRALLPARRYLAAEPAAYLEGLLLGYKNDFTAALKEDMKKSGTTHLIALSGYNVSIIVLAIQKILYGKVPRRVNFYATVGLLLLFVLMVGGEASILRAALMGILFLSAWEIGRLKSFGFALLWTAFVMLLTDPGILFTPGFLLSYASLAGIVYLAPAFLKLFRFADPARRGYALASHIALTAAAQIAVLPLLLSVFGNVSPLSLFANIVLLPFIPLTMFLGFFLLAAGTFASFSAFAVAKVTEVFLSAELGVIHAAARVARPISFSGIPPAFTILYYLALAAFVISYRHGNEPE